jgi:hypothetical protein
MLNSIDKNSSDFKVGKNIASINKNFLVPEYITGTTKMLYEYIQEFDNMGIDCPSANKLMEYNYKVNKIIKYVNATKKDGEFNLENLKECSNSKCESLMPEHSYIDKYGRIMNQCLVCRLHAQIKSKRQTSIETKALWKEENYDKVAKYWLDARARTMENKGIEKYLEDNAKQAKAWRDRNPEKCAEANEKKKCNIKIHYDNYVRDASKKNIKIELTFDEFVEIVKSPCYYCGIIQDKGFNGIDKMNYSKGYIKENSISCCTICNFMKGTLTPEIFLKRVEHILTYQGYIEGKLYPECFADHNNVIFSRYLNRAKEKNLVFEIDKTYFDVLINNKCYICGKKKSNTHYNGIDRINNDEGYTKQNIEPCCGECNYMKNKYDLNVIIEKLRKIKKKHFEHYEIKKTIFRCQDNLDHRKTYNDKKIKMTEEELIIKREKNKLKMQKYREKKNNNLNEDIDNDKVTNIKSETLNNEKIVLANDSGKIQHLNKKTPEQIKEEARLRKQKQREKLKEQYGDEEYKKQRALEISEYRKNKK